MISLTIGWCDLIGEEALVAKWTKDAALMTLQALIAQIGPLKTSNRYSAAHTQWLFRSRRMLEDVFGASSPFSVTFAQLTWGESPPFIVPPGFG
jgi:hypothetical protein